MRSPELDTVRDLKPPMEVQEMMARVFAGESALAKELERMLQQVLRTEVDEDRLVVLFVRNTPVRNDSSVEAHFLPDRTAVVPTQWIMSSRDRVAARIIGEHADLLSEHDDPRGLPVFPSALLPLVITAESYDHALDLLGDEVSFV
jgi:hypothetical protein